MTLPSAAGNRRSPLHADTGSRRGCLRAGALRLAVFPGPWRSAALPRQRHDQSFLMGPRFRRGLCFSPEKAGGMAWNWQNARKWTCLLSQNDFF